MLGLGSSLHKAGKVGKSIVRDGLVLRHDYKDRPVEPVSSGAASFNGTSDYIDMGDVCDLGTGDFSISCWVNLGSTTTSQYIISKYVDADNFWYLRTQGSSQIQFYSKVSGSDVIDRGTGTSLAGNTWHHVAITADRGTATKSYINGVEMGSGASSATDLDNAASLYFGRAGSDYIGGYIANVGIWSAALTQPQIKSIIHKDYAALSASEKEDLVSWWNLDSTVSEDYETSGSTTHEQGEPSTITGLVLDNHDTTFTAVSVTNSDFTSGSGATITGWTNDSDSWTRVNDTIVSGASNQFMRQSVLTNGVAHKAIIRAKRTTAGNAASLRVYFGANNYAEHALTSDFAEYIFHGIQQDDTTLFLYNSVGDVTVDTVELYKYDGNVGILA